MTPLGLGLANVLAFLAPAPAPLALFDDVETHLPEEDSGLGGKEARDAFAQLPPDSGIVLGEDTVTLDAAAAATLRERLGESGRQYCRVAIRLLRGAFPAAGGDVRTWGMCELLLPHARSALAHAEDLGCVDADCIWILDRAAVFELARGSQEAADALIRKALSQAPGFLAEDDPLTGTLHQTMGMAQRALGNLEAARSESERALAIHRQLLAPDDPLVLDDMVDLANVRYDLGQGAGVEEELLAAIEARGGETDAEADYHAQATLGWGRLQAGKPEQAREAYMRGIELAEAKVGPDHPDVASLRGGLGLVLERLGEGDAARRELESAAAVAQRWLGDGHPEVAVIRSNFADVLRSIGDLPAAREQIEISLAAGEATLPENHRGLWIRHRKLASVLKDLREFGPAIEHAEAAHEITTQNHGASDLRAAGDLSMVAEIALADRRGAEAARAYREALEIAQATADGDQLAVAFYHAGLAHSLQLTGNLGEATEHLARTVEIYEGENGAADSLTSLARINLASTTADLGNQFATALVRANRDEDATAVRKTAVDALTAILEGELERGNASSLIGLARVARKHKPSLAATALANAEKKLDDEDEADQTRRQLGTGWHLLGLELLRQEEPGRAIDAFKSCDRLLTGVPHSQSITLHAIGDALMTMGDHDAAVDYYRQALERKREAQEEGYSERIDASATLARLANALLAREDLEEALATERQRLSIIVEDAAHDPLAEANALHDMANVELHQQDFEAAAGHLAQAIELMRRADDAKPRDRAKLLLELGRASLQLRRFDAALAAHEERLRILRSLERREPQAEGVTLHDLGEVWRERGDVAEAAELYERAAELKREAQDGRGGTPADLAVTLLALGRSMESLGHLDRALPAYRDRLEILEGQKDRDPTAEGIALRDLGDVLRESGKPDLAVDYYERAVRRHRKSVADGGPPRSLAGALLGLGRAYLDIERPDKAEAAFDEQLTILRNLPEPDARAEGIALNELGQLKELQGDLAAAVDLYEEAVERKGDGGGGDPESLAITLLALGRARVSLGDFTGGVGAFDERLRLLEALPERKPILEGITLHDLGDVKRLEDCPEEALSLYAEALKRKRADPDASRHRRNIAETLIAISGLEFGIDRTSPRVTVAATEAIELLEGDDPPVRAAALSLIADSALAQDQPQKALPAIEEAIRLLDESGAQSFDLPAALELLAVTHQKLGNETDGERARDRFASSLENLIAPESIARQVEDLLALTRLAGDYSSPELVGVVIDQARRSARGDALGPKHALVALLRHLGRERELMAEDLDGALAAYEEQLGILTSLPDRDPVEEGITLHDLADVRRAQKRYGEAVELYRRAIARRREGDGDPGSTGVPLSLMRLSEVELDLKELPGAREHSDEAIRLLRSAEGDSAYLAEALELRARVAIAEDAPSDAVALLEEAIALGPAEGDPSPDSPTGRRRSLLAAAHLTADASP